MIDEREFRTWEKRRAQLAKSPDVKTLRRPLPNGKTLPLGYVRSGTGASTPVLVLPGGPGLASVAPYRLFRAASAKRGLDVVMVEHRGIGMSRRTDEGADLEPGVVSITNVLDDLRAVLDAEGIERVVVYGSSYGSYLAGAFGARHPERVAAMILDSAKLGAGSRQAAGKALNELYWHGTPPTWDVAARIRTLGEQGTLNARESGFPIQFLHEFGGPEAVDAMLTLREHGKGARVWAWIRRLGAADVTRSRPFMMELDLVGRIAFTELGHGAPHDGRYGPLATDETFVDVASRFPPFEAEPYDLREALPRFTWPMLVLSGDRDIRTPRATAEEITAKAPNATLIPIHDHGHSALDTAQGVALDAMRQLATQGSTTPNLGLKDVAAPRTVIGRLISMRLTLAKLLPKGLS